MRERDYMQADAVDQLASIAFAAEALEEAEALIRSVPPLSPADARLAEEIFDRFSQRAAQEETRRIQAQRRTAFRRVFARVVQVAACLVVAMGIAIPAAIAWVPAFRARVMQLLIQVDQQAGEVYVSFQEDEQAAFDVPSEWTGRYFLSYIPDGMVLDYIGRYGVRFIEYKAEDGRGFFFTENNEDTSMTAGTEGANTYYMTLEGRSLFVTESQDTEPYYIRIVWANDARWFSLQTEGISKEETLRMVRSVREIIK